MHPSFAAHGLTLYTGDCREVIPQLPEAVDAVVCDPPYHLTEVTARFGDSDAAPPDPTAADGAYSRKSRGFMGETWDGGDLAFQPETWRIIQAAVKPGGYLLAFASTRGYHRLATAMEQAGLLVKDCIAYCYSSGFPVGLNLGRALDQAAGIDTSAADYAAPVTPAAQRWDGWHSRLKPALELIAVTQKPLDQKTIAANIRAHGVGALNIAATAVIGRARVNGPSGTHIGTIWEHHTKGAGHSAATVSAGRWPSNVVLGHHPACVVTRQQQVPGVDTTLAVSIPVYACHPDCAVVDLDRQSGYSRTSVSPPSTQPSRSIFGNNGPRPERGYIDAGGASRFFPQFRYEAKAPPSERIIWCEQCQTYFFGHERDRHREYDADTGTLRWHPVSFHPTVKPVGLLAWLIRLELMPQYIGMTEARLQALTAQPRLL